MRLSHKIKLLNYSTRGVSWMTLIMALTNLWITLFSECRIISDLAIWHRLKYAFNAWFLQTYMTSWEKLESCAWCQIIGNLLICVSFFSLVDTFYSWKFTSFEKKSFQVFVSKITVIIIEAKKTLEKLFFNTNKLYTRLFTNNIGRK